jgi:acetyl-CoA synthetase
MPVTNILSDSYAAIHRQFRWRVPKQFNIAQVCAKRWAEDPDTMKNVAVRAHSITAKGRKTNEFLTYQQLSIQANQLSHLLQRMGVKRGDRVAIVLPQRFETAVAYMAVLQMGAIAMPLSMLFGTEALEYRFNDSEAVVAIVDEGTVDAVKNARGQCPALRSLIGIGEAAAQCDVDYALQSLMMPTEFPCVKTLADEAAVLIYTSGTTGPPKGALIPHRALIGNLTGFVASQNWFGFDGRLGLDGRLDGCTLAHAVFWPRDCGFFWAFQPRSDL